MVNLKLVHHHPFGILYFTYDSLELAHSAVYKSGLDEPFALGTVVPETVQTLGMWPELSKIAYRAYRDIPQWC